MFVSECDRNIFTVHIQESKRKKNRITRETSWKPPGKDLETIE